jgi:chlorite dismutase
VSAVTPPPSRGAERHFVKYTFFKVDPAWRRLDAEQRAADKAEFLAACEDFATDHLLQSFSLIGTRGDADMVLIAETENLERIHEFHVVLGQSGLAKWTTQPYSFLGMRKSSEYSPEQRFVARPFRGKYVFVYPFVKTREWYGKPADERWTIMQEHIRIGKEYPDVDNHTTYSFGLDDQEFVVAFDTDDVGAFLDLVHRLRGTEASAYTARDTPSFTCIRTSLRRAVDAIDGEALVAAPAALG